MVTKKGFSKHKIILILIILVGLGSYYFYSKYQAQSSESKQKPVKVAPVVSDDTPNPNGNNSTQKKFVSEKLGISFLYLEEQGGQKIKVEESNNKIYVFTENSQAESGQYVEVFSKEPQKPLLTAVEEKFLQGYSKNDCEALTVNSLIKKYPDSYEIVNIRVVGEIKDLSDLNERYKKCPQVYTQSNGVSYFLGDQNHKDKYLFFSIGQYGIIADDSTDNLKTWQDTIQFLD
jgi:hypothetical protein